MFPAFSNNNQGQSPFGQQTPKPNTGFFSQNNTNSTAFGQNAPSPFGQPQNTSPFGQNTGGQGMFQGQPQQPQQGGGLFGQPSPNPGTGLFGQNNGQMNAPGMFGGQQQPNNGGLFGGQPQQNPTVFGGQQQANQGGGVFGQTNQPTQQGGIFGLQSNPSVGQPGNNSQGAGLFGANNNNQGGLFGQTNQNPGGNGGFGAVSNNTNQSFLGNQGNSFQANNNLFGGSNPNQGNQGLGLFGNTQPPATSPFGNPAQNTNMFGANTQQQQPATGGNGLFGTFGNNNQNNAGNMFGNPNATNNLSNNMFGQNNQNQSFNQNQTAFNPNATMNNKLGGTSWGVPTNPQGTQPQPVGGAQAIPIQPVRSKNPKLDAKHLIKCIAALDQFQGLCKEQLRVNFIQAGGQQPAISQQPVAGFKPLGQNTNTPPITSLPSFGGTQNVGATGGNTLFGGQSNTQSNLFVKPVGNAPTGGGFGAPNQQPNSLFGGQQQTLGAPQTNSLFGQNNTGLQPNPLNGQQPQQNTLFGSNPANPAPSGTLFGQQANQGAPFNSNPLQPPPSLFNQTSQGQTSQPPSGSLFSAPPAGNTLFGQPQNTSLTPNFAQALGAAVTASTSGLAPNSFNTSSLPNTNTGQNTSLFSQLASPLYQSPPPQMDQSAQLLLPQLLMNFILSQPQQSAESATGNSALDALHKLVMTLNQNNPNQLQNSSNSLINPTPFDQYLKEQTTDKWSNKPTQKYSLFSQAEIRQFSDIDYRSYIRYNSQSHNDFNSDRILHNSRPTVKRADPFTENTLKVINKQYKGVQQQNKRKYTPTNEELPEIGHFSIYPSLDRLKNMTVAQIKKVQKVKIFNSYGTVQFLQPISLYKLDVSKAIKISQDNIQIINPELEEKKIRITFHNFGMYTKLKGEQQKRLMRKMRQWIETRGMNEISHSIQTGDLVVQTLQ